MTRYTNTPPIEVPAAALRGFRARFTPLPANLDSRPPLAQWDARVRRICDRALRDTRLTAELQAAVGKGKR